VRPAFAPLVAALALAGCGAAGVGRARQRAPQRPHSDATAVSVAVARADRTHELPTPAGRQAVLGGWRSPVQAVDVFADTYINWTAATVSGRLQALSEVSLGQARSAMALAAAQTGHDGELQRGEVANSGAVEAIAPLAGHARQYIVVTREQTSASGDAAVAGLAPAWHVALATVTQVPGRLWVLSAWQPES
jgi:hypothetical protein